MRRFAMILAVVGIAFTTASAAQTRDENWTRCKDDNPDLRIGACTTLIQSGRESNTDLALAFHNRGIGYYDTDQFDKALADYAQELKLNPNANAYYERGMTYWAKRDYTRALADLDTAITMRPSYLYYVMRGNAHDDNNQLDLAIQDYAAAIKLDPSMARAYAERCVAYTVKMLLPAAIADCDKAIQLDGKYANAFATRGRAYAAQGEAAKAFADFDKALSVNPGRVAKNTAYKYRAILRYKRGEYPLALADFDASLAIYPDSAESLYGRGMAKRASGNVQGGNVDVASAKQLSANIADTMARLGVQ